MRTLLAAFIACLALAIAPRADAQALTISPGESVIIHFDDSGGPVLVQRDVSTLSPWELYAAEELTSGRYDYAVGGTVAEIQRGPKRPEHDPIAPYAVRLNFVQGPTPESVLLFIENGYGQAFRYRAMMARPGVEPEHTDVCLVRPNVPMVEHWPHPIDRLDLSALRLQAWTEGDEVTCE